MKPRKELAKLIVVDAVQTMARTLQETYMPHDAIGA